MLHILTTLLATALLAVSTGSNALKENKEKESNQTFSLRTEPKRAYYDPAETYGTTPDTAYNYTSNGMRLQTQTGPQVPPTIPSGSSYNPYTSSTMAGSGPHEGLYYFPADLIPSQEAFEAQETTYYDVYINGVFTETLQTPYYGGSNSLFLENSSGYYVWFFDHQEIDPIEEMNENIFEAVGDTITGLSDALASPWEGILNIFYDTTENEVTQMGYLLLIGLGVSITLLVFWTILRLFKQRN